MIGGEVDWIDDGEGIQELEELLDAIRAGQTTFSGEELEILHMVFDWANDAREAEYMRSKAMYKVWTKIARARGIDLDDSDFEDMEFDD